VHSSSISPKYQNRPGNLLICEQFADRHQTRLCYRRRQRPSRRKSWNSHQPIPNGSRSSTNSTRHPTTSRPHTRAESAQHPTHVTLVPRREALGDVAAPGTSLFDSGGAPLAPRITNRALSTPYETRPPTGRPARPILPTAHTEQRARSSHQNTNFGVSFPPAEGLSHSQTSRT